MAAMIASAAVLPLAAQEERLTVDVGRCINLAAPEERLACFEAQVEAARRAPPAAPAPAGAAAPAAVAAPAAAANDSRRSDEREARAPDIIAKVAELRETVPNAYLITLDNGQVWRQTQPKYYPLRLGSEVRVYESRWRAFRLTNEELSNFIQVERVR